MIGLATGMALEGKKVFTYSIGNFATLRCLEQIRNDAAYHDVNINIVSIGGGFSYGSLGISHHATEDLAILRSLPNLTLASPCGLWETEQATKALFNSPGTGFLRLDKSTGNDKPNNANEKFKSVHLTSFLNYLISNGIKIKCLPYKGKWFEFDDAEDLSNFINY